MYHIVQENMFKEPHFNKLIETLDKMNLEYEFIKVIPFVDEIEYKTDRKDVMIWGAIKLARLARKENWTGSFMSDKHDYDYYSKHYKDNLLNYDSKIIKFYDRDTKLPDRFFARPTKDSKAFTGKIMDKEEFEVTRSVLIKNNWVKEDFNIQISSIKNIYAEGRFWCVKGKIITGSLYMRGGKYHLEEVLDDDPMWGFAQQMVDLHQIADAFVIDICRTDKGMKCVELGCINCAGFYLADMQKLVNSIEENF